MGRASEKDARSALSPAAYPLGKRTGYFMGRLERREGADFKKEKIRGRNYRKVLYYFGRNVYNKVWLVRCGW